MTRLIVEIPDSSPEHPENGQFDEIRRNTIYRLITGRYPNRKGIQVMLDDRPRGMQYQCPDCPWVEYQNRYGWDRHNIRAVEVHQQHLCPKVKEKEGRASVSE